MQDFSTLLRDIRDVGENIVATAKDIQLLLETKEDFDKDDRIFKLKHASSLAGNILPLLAYLSTLDFKSIDRQKELTDEVRKLEFSSFALKSILLSLPSRFSKYTIHEKKINNLLNILNISANRIITISFLAKQINYLAESSNMFYEGNNNVCYKSKNTCENECYDGICYEDECSTEIKDFARCPEYTETFTESPHVHVENGYHKDKRMYYDKPSISINKEYVVREEIRSSAGRVFSSDKITENIHKGDLKVNINNNKLSQAISHEYSIENVEQQSERNGHLDSDDTVVTERTFLYPPIEHESLQNHKSLQVKEEPEDVLNSFNHRTGNDNISQQNENFTIKTNLHKGTIADKYLTSKLDGMTQGNDAINYLLQLIRKHNKSVPSSEPNICLINSSITLCLTNENVKRDGNAITRTDHSGLENSYLFRDSILKTKINSVSTNFEFNGQSKMDQTHAAISGKNSTTNETMVETPKRLTQTYFDLYNIETPNFPFKTVICKNATHSYYDARDVEETTTPSNETAESSEIPMQSHTVAYTGAETTKTGIETLLENYEVTTRLMFAPYATEETTYTSYVSYEGPKTTAQSYYESSATEEITASSYETITENPETTTQSYYSSYSPEETTSHSYEIVGPETTTHESYDTYTTEDTTIHSYGTTTETPESTTQTYYETTTTAYETTTQDLYKVSQDISSVAQDLSTKASEISCMTSDISSKISDICSMVSDLSSYDNEELSKKVQSVSKLTQEINSKTSEISSLSSTTSSLASDISSASSDMTTADRNHAFRTTPWQKMSNKGQDMITSTQGMITAAQDILVKIDSVVSSTADMVVADTVASLAYEITAKTQRLISETLSIVSAVIDLMNAIDS